MLYYFNKFQIRTKQAFKHHKSFSFGAWNKNILGERTLEKVVLNDVYEHWSFVTTIQLYYNGVVIEDNYSKHNDFYGFGTSILGMQDTIDNIVKRFNLNENDKLEIRVLTQTNQEFFYLTNNGFNNVPNNWYLCFEDVLKYYQKLDNKEDVEDSSFNFLKLSQPFIEGDIIEVHSSLKDGFQLNQEKIEKLCSEFISKHGLTVSDDVIDLEKK